MSGGCRRASIERNSGGEKMGDHVGAGNKPLEQTQEVVGEASGELLSNGRSNYNLALDGKRMNANQDVGG